jgi:hypothetical protein
MRNDKENVIVNLALSFSLAIIEFTEELEEKESMLLLGSF